MKNKMFKKAVCLALAASMVIPSAAIAVRADGEDSSASKNVVTCDFGTFENTYTADSVYVSLQGAKKLTDASKSGRKLQANEFSFTLKDSTGKIVETVKNDKDGKVKFSDIEYKTPGTYTYTIVEDAGSDAHIKYDKAVKTITVTVTGTDGKLSATTSATSETPVEAGD